jgi:hypothetical protein
MPNPKSSSIFHYTKTLDVLKSILRNGFWPKYSPEDVSWIFNDPSKVAFPMVCFCDIPLSRVEQHTKFYGEYGIGLTQTWAIQRGLSPITYISHNSALKKEYRRFADYTNRHPEIEIESAFYSFMAYSKPFRGKMPRNGSDVLRSFYPECEWRHIPRIQSNHVDAFFYPNKFKDKSLVDQSEITLAEDYALKFPANDVKFLIVKDENEIIEMYNFLKDKTNFTPDECKLLTSRITTLKDIHDNY